VELRRRAVIGLTGCDALTYPSPVTIVAVVGTRVLQFVFHAKPG
jgi:hypothetical protein